MAEDGRKAARQRASFARADRLKKEEAAQQQEPAERFVITKRGRVYPIAADDPGIPASEYYKGVKLPDMLKDARVYLTPRGPVVARPERPDEQWRDRDRAKQTEKKAEAQRTAEQKQDAERKAIDQAKKEAAKTAGQKAEQQKVAETRKAEQRKQEEQQKADRKREADQKAEQQKAQAKQEAQKQAEERKAAAYVLAEFKRQQADQIAEHRRQTDRLRTQHREQSSSLKGRDGEAIDRHWHAVKTIDNRETQALKAFDVKRASLTGRATELVRGKAHFEKQREDIQKRFESDRLHKHRDLEALKERQFTAQQEQRLRHAHERKAMFETHREARQETMQRQERDRPRLIEQRLQAVVKNAEIARTHQQEQTQEHGRSMRSELGR